MQLDNYKIINNNQSNSNVCYVFCSSNGLFWGTRDENFVIKNNYFEFMNIAKDKRISNYKKMIFIRDMHVSFYVTGINEDIDDITKLIEFIKKETIGLQLIIVGVSAGAYLANLLGLFLPNVKCVYGLGTVFNVRLWHGRHSYNESKYLLESERDSLKNQYYDLYPIFEKRLDNSKTRFYYFYGNKNKLDLEIATETRNRIVNNNFVFIPIKSKDHGCRFSYNLYVSLLTISKELNPKKKAYSKFMFELYLVGFKKTAYNILLFLKYKIAKIFKKISILKNKINRYFQIKTAFKYAKYLLRNGYYCVDDRTIKSLDTVVNKRFYERFRVNTKKKDINPVCQLYFVITRYKKIFVTDNESYFYFKSRKKYISFRQRYYEYGLRLPYNHISLKFNEKKNQVVGNIAKGTKYKNNEKYDKIVGLLLRVASEQDAVNKSFVVGAKSIKVPFFIQHGDFKNSNIIWDEDNYNLIDLEEVNEYPLFFDLFFYIFISKPNSFLDTLFDAEFVNRIKSIWLRKDEKLHFDYDYVYIDYSLSIYLSFLLDKYKLEQTKEFFDYYLFWTNSKLLDDKRLLSTKLIINTNLTKDNYFKRNLTNDTMQ